MIWSQSHNLCVDDIQLWWLLKIGLKIKLYEWIHMKHMIALYFFGVSLLHILMKQQNHQWHQDDLLHDHNLCVDDGIQLWWLLMLEHKIKLYEWIHMKHTPEGLKHDLVSMPKFMCRCHAIMMIIEARSQNKIVWMDSFET